MIDFDPRARGRFAGNTYMLAWPDAADTVLFHTAALDDISSGTEKYWSFNTCNTARPRA
jgi:hypothetical protein